MHELSVTQQLLDIVLRKTDCQDGEYISDLYLVIGDLSSIVDESVQFYWPFVSAGTPAEQAQLNFRRIPALMQCRSCQHTYSPDDSLPCPECGSTNVFVQAGEEFYIEAIEVRDKAESKDV